MSQMLWNIFVHCLMMENIFSNGLGSFCVIFWMKLEFHELFFVILTVIVFSIERDFRYFMECLQINKTVNFDIKELILFTFPT
jgi:hypothetical protein